MLIEQIYIDNPARNFNYLIACEKTSDALAIDPLDADRCQAVAQSHGWVIKYIVNTHEHWDHIGGNEALIAATGAQLLAHADAQDSIADINRKLVAEDCIHIGRTVQLRVLDTPGHTLKHICLLTQSAKQKQAALFSGDTLFNAGCGNCIHGGDPHALFHTLTEQLYTLPDETVLYPGHDYVINNLNFAHSIEPDNQTIINLQHKLKEYDPHHPFVSTIGMEKKINPFFRLQSVQIIQQLRAAFPTLEETPSTETVFLKLRELRNRW